MENVQIDIKRLKRTVEAYRKSKDKGTLSTNILPKQTSLKARILVILKRLAGKVPHRRLRRAMGGLAFFVCLGTTASSQIQLTFSSVPGGLNDIGTAAFFTWADLDMDGDFDMMSGSSTGDFIFQRNTGPATIPSFDPIQSNPFALTINPFFNTPAFVDLDGDGDFDIVAGNSTGDFAYYKDNSASNTPAFGSRIVNPFGLADLGSYSSPAFADLDADGDLDMVSGDGIGNFSYFENIGSASAPSFAARQSNPFGLLDIGTYSTPALVDLDLDGDLDLFAGETGGDIFYFENTGSATVPQFASPIVNPFGILSGFTYSAPSFVDLDADGDFDLMVGRGNGGFVYYKNESVIVSRSKPISNNTIQFGQDPLRSNLNISSDHPIDFSNTEIRAWTIGGEEIMLGQSLMINGDNTAKLSYSGWGVGIYFVEVLYHGDRYIHKLAVLTR